MKLPYTPLLVYCVVSDMPYSQVNEWMNMTLGLPVDLSLYTAIKKRKFGKDWSNSLVKYVNDTKQEIEAITRGFGRPEIFTNIISLITNGVHFQEASDIVKNKFNFDFSKYKAQFILIYEVSDWDNLDWDRYFKFLKLLPDNKFGLGLPLARFSPLNELLYTLGIGVADFAQDALLVHEKQSRIYHRELDSGRIIENITALGALYDRSINTLSLLTEKGLIVPQKAGEEIEFAISKSKHESITKPEFDNIDTGGLDGNKKSE